MHLGDLGALRLELLQPSHVGLGHRLVGVQAEQQGHVDVDPLANQGGDRRRPRPGPGDLDHQVIAAHRLPQPAALGDGAVGVEGEIGRDLKADVAVAAGGAIPDRLQHIGGVLDVLDRDLLVELHGAEIALRQGGLEAVVVVAALSHRLLEDRGIGRDAGNGVLGDQALQLAAFHELAMHVVEPDRLAGLGQPGQRIRHAFSWMRSRPRPSWRLAASSTFSVVNPKCDCSALAGADMPKLCMATTSPVDPA